MTEVAMAVSIGKRQNNQSIMTADVTRTAMSAATFNDEFFMPTTPKLSTESHFLRYKPVIAELRRLSICKNDHFCSDVCLVNRLRVSPAWTPAASAAP